MRKNILFGLSTIFSLLIIAEATGQAPPPAKMTSTTKPSSTLEGMKSLEPAQQKKSTSTSTKESLPAPITPPTLLPQRSEYLHPGILVFLNGRWEGSDHLLNITNNIGVYVSIIKPENEAIDVNETQIQKEIESIFAEASIRPQTLAAGGKPPLPAFEIEIFIYPIERGYVACCQGRLFESVTLERFKMDPNMAFQAITWEKQNLIVSPKAQFAEQLTKTVQEIANAFTERFLVYERFKRNAG